MNVRQQLDGARLYVVLDREVNPPRRLMEIINECIAGGADIIQYRDKKSSALETLSFCQAALNLTRGRIPFIVNDRLDIALACQADGIHVGQEDLPLDAVRGITGKDMVIGVSCQTVDQACVAQQCGADYIGFGSVYKTLTKPQRSGMDLNIWSQISQTIAIPVFAIGGIAFDDLKELMALGVRRVAVTRAVCLAQDVAAACRRFKQLLSAVDQGKADVRDR